MCASMSFLMKNLLSTSSSVPLKSLPLLSPPCLHSPPLCTFGYFPKIHGRKIEFSPTSRALGFPTNAANLSNQEAVSVVEFEDFVEKDWSFLDADDTNTDGGHMDKIDRIISAGNIKVTSNVLVSIGTEAFVDRVVQTSLCEQLLVVHDSLLILACIKESYDKVKCWQGDLINVPEKWAAFDVVFLYFLPALPFELNQVLGVLAKRCLPGARIVIGHPQGRQFVEEQQKQHPDVVVSNFPEKMNLQSTAINHSFQVVEFVDEPHLYLAVLIFDQQEL